MTIRTRLSLWYATIMFVSLLAMGVLTYRQFAPDPAEKATPQEQADENDLFEQFAKHIRFHQKSYNNSYFV